MPALNVKTDFGAVPGTDCTLQFENAVAAAKSEGLALEVPPEDGLTYKLQHLNFGNIEMFGSLGTVIEHIPPDNNTDCMWITSDYEKPTILRDLTIKGAPNAGRDLLSVRKGNHPKLINVWMQDANRHGFKAIPQTGYYWIENLDLFYCHVLNAKEDPYVFEIPDGGLDANNQLKQPDRFINCTTMYGCESRLGQRHALRLSSLDTNDKNAKISSFSVIGGEYAVDYGNGLDPIIKLEAQNLNPLGGFIEDVSFYNTTIEYPGSIGKPSQRDGHMMEISGIMKGFLDFRASTWHGSLSFMKGFRNFPDYDVYDAIARRWFRSQQGITDEFKSDVNINPTYEQYTGVTCVTGEIIKGYVFERYNNDKVYAEFTVINGKALFVTGKIAMDIRLDNGQIVLQNLHNTALKFEMIFQRIAVATSY